MKRISLALLGFVLLLSASAFLFGAELGRRALERELHRLLGVPVRIERWAFTPRRLTLHGVSFQMPQAASVPLLIERIQLEGSPLSSGRPLTLTGLNLSVAGVPIQAQGRVFITAVPGSYALSEGWLSVEHPLLRGRIEVTGRLLEPVVLGWLQGVRGPPCHFVGQWKIRRDSIQLVRMEMQGGWRAEGRLSSGSEGELNIAGPEERIRLKVAPAGAGSMRAEWWMYRPDLPVWEIAAEWSIRRNQLELQASLAPANRLTGRMALRPPYRTHLALELQDLRVEELAEWIGGTSSPAISGRLEGHVILSGPIRDLSSRGELSLRDGTLGEGAFQTIGLRFDGKGPLLKVESTVRTASEKVYVGEGSVDLRRIARPEFLSGLRWSSPERDLQLAGWLMSLTPGPSGLQMRRPIGSQEAVKVNVEKEEQFVSVEHRKKF